MPGKYSYVLTRLRDKERTIVGVFTSIFRLRGTLKKLPRNYGYKVYKIPVNTVIAKGRELIDQIDQFGYQYYGTHTEIVIEADRGGNITGEREKKVIWWPNYRERVE